MDSIPWRLWPLFTNLLLLKGSLTKFSTNLTVFSFSLLILCIYTLIPSIIMRRTRLWWPRFCYVQIESNPATSCKLHVQIEIRQFTSCCVSNPTILATGLWRLVSKVIFRGIRDSFSIIAIL